ncbi:MAG: hypothetical protein ACTHMI_12445 [Mucilaginibacter sp.]
MDKPLICTFNLSDKVYEQLEKSGYHLYKGSIGKQIMTGNKHSHDSKLCLPLFDSPSNFHEFDVVIIDLTNDDKIPYSENDHERSYNKTGNNYYLLSAYPQNIFDPRPYSLNLLKAELDFAKKRIMIVFCSENDEVNYRMVEKRGSSYDDVTSQKITTYSFYSNCPIIQNKQGFETEILSDINPDLKYLLEKHNSALSYNITFFHPTIWKDSGNVKAPDFTPLIINNSKEIVSFYQLRDKMGSFFFPDIQDKAQFLNDFLQEVAPSFFPDIFPESEKNKWTNDKPYYLPNHDTLLQQRASLVEEFDLKLKVKDEEIETNLKKYEFLHKIITKTDDELVSSVIAFLKWLGFENVKDMDQHGSQKKEDIQVETKDGLLIIEVKGIGGTSKDSDCSQIGKHKHRRSRERGKFDVSALYIVNHQRHMPPLSRKNPPFTHHQIGDAIEDERGLLTTWELFKLYHNIENGIISKEEARLRLYDFGLVDFYKSFTPLGKPKEVLKKGEVFILDLEDEEIKVGDILLLKDNGYYFSTPIISIHENDKSVASAANSEVGIKTSCLVTKQTEIFIKK